MMLHNVVHYLPSLQIILFWIIYPSLPGMKPTYCPSRSGYVPLIRHTQQLGTARLFPAPKQPYRHKMYCARSVSSASVVISIWRLCQNIFSMASSNLKNKFIQNYGIEILKKRKNIDGKQSVIFRCNTSLHSDKLV